MTGKSTQNTRVERLWRDYNSKVVSRFRIIFQDLEAQGVLGNRNADNWDIDRICLTRVFLWRIQTAAYNFVAAWDYHMLSTERNKSPLRLWLEGWRMSQNSQDFPDDENYASEWEPNVGDSDDSENPSQVVIDDPIILPGGINEEDLERFAVEAGADIGGSEEAIIAYVLLRAAVRDSFGL